MIKNESTVIASADNDPFDLVGLCLDGADARGATQPNAVVFLDAGRLATTGFLGGNVWRLDGAPEADLPSEDNLRDLELSPNGRLLAVVEKDGVTFWDTATLKKVHRIKSIAPLRLRFSPDGTRLAVVGGEKRDTIAIWQVKIPP